MLNVARPALLVTVNRIGAEFVLIATVPKSLIFGVMVNGVGEGDAVAVAVAVAVGVGVTDCVGVGEPVGVFVGVPAITSTDPLSQPAPTGRANPR